MGHRALVAYEQHDGRYSLHYSHWGAADLKLKHAITPETPFGGPDEDAAWANDLLQQLLEGVEPEAVGGYLTEKDHVTSVEPQPMATGLTREEILADYLDYLHHEAYYKIDHDLDVTAYRTLWFGLQYDSDRIEEGETVGNGAVVTVGWHDGQPLNDAFLRGQFRALRDIVGDLLVDRDHASEREAIAYMREQVAGWAGQHQEVIFAPATRAD